MKIPAIVPQIGREAVVVIGGALLAAVIMSRLPLVKHYIKNAWA